METRDVNGYSPPRLSTGTWRQKGVDSNQEPRTLSSFDTPRDDFGTNGRGLATNDLSGVGISDAPS